MFISYSHADEMSVLDEIRQLQALGVRVYFDAGISPGSEWSDALAQAIKQCSRFVFFITPRSVASENCRRELNFALEEGRPVLAVQLEKTNLPDGIRLNLNNRQAILRYRLSDEDYIRALQGALGLTHGENSGTVTVSVQNRKSGWRAGLAIGVSAVMLIAVVAIRYQYISTQDQQAREELIASLIDEGRSVEAFGVARTAENPGSYLPLLDTLVVRGSIQASEAGAAVSIKPYYEPSADWIYLGSTPIEDELLPTGSLRIRFEAPGFETVEFAALNPGPYFHNASQPTLDAYQVPYDVPLVLENSVPEGMVRIPETTLDVPMFRDVADLVHLSPYFIDRFEVSNSEYKSFVDSGGYENPEYWTELVFDEDGETLSWADATSRFLDSTGRPGPATWELGSYPFGRGELPVTGVSWYEAVAYSRFIGKSLPTAGQWTRAAFAISIFSPAWQDSVVVANFESGDAIAREASASLGPFGTYNMPGNAREWIWNEQGGMRVMLGGGYTEPAKLFSLPQRRPAFDRAIDNGIRLVMNPEPISDEDLAALPLIQRDLSDAVPLSEEAFQGLIAAYTYAPGDSGATVLSVEERAGYLKEVVEIDTGYGERLQLYLFRPGQTGPFETIIFMGGASDFLYSHDSAETVAKAQAEIAEPFVTSGRAFVYPVWTASFERYDGAEESGTNGEWRAIQVRRMTRWYQELGRIIDYLDERTEYDAEAIAFMGISFGGMFGVNLLAVEPRVKVGIIVSGGIWPEEFHPLYDPLNYFSRFKQPILMLTGENDFAVDPDTIQIPSFERLTTEHKRQVIFPATGHWPFPRTRYLKEVGDWLDRFL